MLIWGFWFDDELVDDLPANSPLQAPAIASLLRMLDVGRGTGAAGAQLEAAFSSVLDGLGAELSAGQFARWCLEMRLWFTSLLLQNRLRATDTVPGVETYKTVRRYTVCSYAPIVLLDASWGSGVDWDDYYQPDLVSLRSRASNVTAWQNDIFSFFSEQRHPGNFWNLPTVYMAHGCTAEEAIRKTAGDAALEVEAFIRHAARAEPSLPAAQRMHIRSLRSWMRGCYDWSHEATGRYVGWRVEA
ncbi:terpene synthase family protein [Qaidamihabitans albus]|uniref:terpene synthase family protein n=1 Tax=Qaidamihabitans albus TaxID=2795733 RepID=UPI0018F15D3F|nr:terpene synthase family protein [Qaidamihabitans albus]